MWDDFQDWWEDKVDMIIEFIGVFILPVCGLVVFLLLVVAIADKAIKLSLCG